MLGMLAINRRAFSLIELVIVVVIIGIIAAIAIPKMSRGANAAQDNSLSANLKVLRSAIDLYETEHGKFPTKADIVNQLTQYTDDAGTPNAAKTGNFIYGPYLREVPHLPVGAKKGQSGISDADGATIGWLYNETTGAIKANTVAAEVDVKGKKYSDY